MPVLKILTGLAFGIAGAVCSITALQRHRRIRRACERCRGTRPNTQEEAEALARGAEDAQGTRTVASDRAVLEAQSRSLACMN
jgi:orotidine-5'-phosphate decarboxylase